MVAAFVAAAGPATAHAIIVEAKPDVGATVVGTNLPIDLRFNSKIDHARSRVWLTGPQQITVTIAKDAAVDRLIGQVGMIAPGDYVLHWQVLAVDGHITRGDIPFSVAAP
jgi:hypothetical protein